MSANLHNPSRNLGRPTSDADRLALKSATRRACTLSGGVDSVSHVTRAATGTLSRYGGPDYPDFTPIDVALDIDRDCGQPIHAAALAHAQGFRLVRIVPDVQTPEAVRPVTFADGVGLIEAATSALREIEKAVQDGSLSENERHQIRIRLDAIMSRSADLSQSLSLGAGVGDPS